LVDGVTPVPGVTAYLYKLPIKDSRIEVIAQAVSDENGHYRMPSIPLGSYRLTAFKADFSDGNLAYVTVKFNSQTVKADLNFRGGNGGGVQGVVVDASNTPIKARVGISGDQVVIAGGKVGIDFQYVQNFEILDTDFSTGSSTTGGLWPGASTIRAAGQSSPDPIALEATMLVPTTVLDVTLKLQPT